MTPRLSPHVIDVLLGAICAGLIGIIVGAQL